MKDCEKGTASNMHVGIRESAAIANHGCYWLEGLRGTRVFRVLINLAPINASVSRPARTGPPLLEQNALVPDLTVYPLGLTKVPPIFHRVLTRPQRHTDPAFPPCFHTKSCRGMVRSGSWRKSYLTLGR